MSVDAVPGMPEITPIDGKDEAGGDPAAEGSKGAANGAVRREEGRKGQNARRALLAFEGMGPIIRYCFLIRPCCFSCLSIFLSGREFVTAVSLSDEHA